MSKLDEQNFAYITMFVGMLCGIICLAVGLLQAEDNGLFLFMVLGMIAGAGFSAAILMAVIMDIFGFGK